MTGTDLLITLALFSTVALIAALIVGAWDRHARKRSQDWQAEGNAKGSR